MGMPVSTTSARPTSRRALLAGALSGLGVWAASAVGRASPVRAEGEVMHVGGEYDATSTTTLRNQTTIADVFRAETNSGNAIRAHSNHGIGLWATSTDTFGVVGQSNSRIGVFGSSESNTGVLGESSFGFALRAEGRVKFSTSGVATIPAGSSSKLVTPGVNVTTTSFVLLTPKVNIGSRALWFTTNASAESFRISMSSPRPTSTKVAWLLVG